MTRRSLLPADETTGDCVTGAGTSGRMQSTKPLAAKRLAPGRIQREVPERANRKPPEPTRALPRSVHNIRDGSPVADQTTAVTTGARALAIIVGMVRAPLMAP